MIIFYLLKKNREHVKTPRGNNWKPNLYRHAQTRIVVFCILQFTQTYKSRLLLDNFLIRCQEKGELTMLTGLVWKMHGSKNQLFHWNKTTMKFINVPLGAVVIQVLRAKEVAENIFIIYILGIFILMRIQDLILMMSQPPAIRTGLWKLVQCTCHLIQSTLGSR